jgi:hypothetical protein
VSAPLFIVGAGFNLDANAEAGRAPLPSAYPLVGQIAQICFGLEAAPPGKSVEQLFHDAIAARNHKPIDILCDTLMQADYYLAEGLCARDSRNSYRMFIEHFPASHFLTFNYDSLLEIVLFALDRWRPEDGYGVPVDARLEPIQTPPRLVSSQNLVLHLHGSLCVYASEFSVNWTSAGRSHTGEIEHRDAPLFRFDPDSITHRFFPYRREPPDQSYRYPSQRIIVPLPDKAEGLRESFIRSIHRHARELASEAGKVASIGYSFNAHDRASYSHLLQAIASRSATVTLVSPDATQIKARLQREYPVINWIALFADVQAVGFTGPSESR